MGNSTKNLARLQWASMAKLKLLAIEDFITLRLLIKNPTDFQFTSWFFGIRKYQLLAYNNRFMIFYNFGVFSFFHNY